MRGPTNEKREQLCMRGGSNAGKLLEQEHRYALVKEGSVYTMEAREKEKRTHGKIRLVFMVSALSGIQQQQKGVHKVS
ncbi:hypothetical protein BC939DRAFT_446661 [Gamsiella multidivaricata]|uniref:uncharacterized protein n=1 Tax=Gamsiella multidivaricata TaxID=101098 RepID=UPI00221F3D08|nr:uncharacterized protein BC939DRAFT_446661 [Gamsiella multidivaricata]KAI7826529.1 hypothetical protein BC939DRAFT_446661 [Gamsiella multidivaricata]